jgi:hypothetical protein
LAGCLAGGGDLWREKRPPYEDVSFAMEVPRETDTQVVVVAIVRVVVVDVPAIPVKVAHADAVAVRVKNLLASVRGTRWGSNSPKDLRHRLFPSEFNPGAARTLGHLH